MNQIDLTSRRAVITGGAQGIGRATVERFLASNAIVSIWDADPKELQSTASDLRTRGRIHTLVVDVSDPAQVDAAATATANELGGIDILVANAGIAGPNHTTWENPLDQWRRVIDINLMGVYHCCRSIVPLMIKQQYGRIVNIASIAGKEGNPNASAYSASKAGVIALTKSLGKELATQNVAVNCITPAAARTRIFDQMAPSHIDFMLSKIPRGRFVTPEEVAALIAWVA